MGEQRSSPELVTGAGKGSQGNLLETWKAVGSTCVLKYILTVRVQH